MPGPLTPRDPSSPLRTKRGFQHIAGQEQNPGTFFAGPAVRPALPPTFRAIVATDLPASMQPLTTKGDLFTFTTVAARLPVGTDGFALFADSTQTTGLSYKPGTYVLSAQFTAVANVGTGTTTMMTYTVPAGLFVNAGDTIRVRAVFSFNPGGGAEAINVNWGSQLLTTIVPNGNAGAMRVDLLFQKITLTTQNTMVDFFGTVGAVGTVVVTGTQTLSGTVLISFTASSANGSNFIFQNVMLVEFTTA